MRFVGKPFPRFPVGIRNNHPLPCLRAALRLKAFHKAGRKKFGSALQRKFDHKTPALKEKNEFALVPDARHVDEAGDRHGFGSQAYHARNKSLVPLIDLFLDHAPAPQ